MPKRSRSASGGAIVVKVAGRKRKGDSAGAASRAKRAKGGHRASASTVVIGSARPKRNRRTGGFLDQELKYRDVINEAGTVAEVKAVWDKLPVPGVVDNQALNSVPVGDGPDERDGRRILQKNIRVNGLVIWPELTTTALSVERGHVPVTIALILDMQTNRAFLDPEKVYETPTPGGDDDNYLGHRDLEWTKRYKVLAKTEVQPDQFQVIQNGAEYFLMEQKKSFELFANLDDLVTQFTEDGTTGEIGAIIDNSLHLITCRPKMVVENPLVFPQVRFTSRLRFYA